MSDGKARFEIHEHPLAGYLINSSRYGRFRVSPATALMWGVRPRIHRTGTGGVF